MDRPSTSDMQRIWLVLCLISLIAYLLFSQAIPEFIREVARLAGRL